MSEPSADLDAEIREVLWARVNRVLAEGGDKVDVWWLRGVLQHRDDHDDPDFTCPADQTDRAVVSVCGGFLGNDEFCQAPQDHSGRCWDRTENEVSP